MTLRIHCFNEACRARFCASFPPQAQPPACPRCGRAHEPVSGAIEGRTILVCPLCGGDELYVRKDFPQRAGLALVVLVAVVSFWLFARGELLWALGVLLAVVLLDLVVYLVVPRITVCYRCRTEICGAETNPDHRGFDLATAEKYR